MFEVEAPNGPGPYGLRLIWFGGILRVCGIEDVEGGKDVEDARRVLMK